MTAKEIRKSNVLIAEFMGMKAAVIKDGIGYYDASELEYDTNWSWLMSVVEKIEGIGQTTVQIFSRSCEITPIVYSKVKDSMTWHKKIYVFHGSKIESVYVAVYQFVLWYDKFQSTQARIK